MRNYRLIERQIKPWYLDEPITEYAVQEFRRPYGTAWYAPLEWCDNQTFSTKESAEAYLKKEVEREEERERQWEEWERQRANSKSTIEEPIKRTEQSLERFPRLLDCDDAVLVPCFEVRIVSALDERTRSNDR